eukprot:3915864-Pleurochrysis_carterae.AAC.2
MCAERKWSRTDLLVCYELCRVENAGRSVSTDHGVGLVNTPSALPYCSYTEWYITIRSLNCHKLFKVDQSADAYPGAIEHQHR